MWEEGKVTINGQLYTWEAKVYEEGSEYGVNSGPISKLNVWKKTNYDSLLVMVYDRGWITEEPNGEMKNVLEAILSEINSIINRKGEK